MKVTFPFGHEFITEDLPEDVVKVKATWTPSQLKAVPNLEEAIKQALDHPLEASPIEEQVNASSRVVIAFDDPTVMNFSPLRSLAVKELLRRLQKCGVKKENIVLICASAIHRRFDTQEIASVIGADIVKEYGCQVFSHDAEDKENLTFLGKTPEGYEVELSRYVCDSDLTIYINASSLRGLTGGWKSICVGLSTYRSIRWHHTPDGLSAKIDHNPLHDILNAMGKVVEAKLGRDRIFKIDVVTKNPYEIAAIFAGHTSTTRAKVLEIMRAQPREKPIPEEKVDILIYGVPAFSPYAVFSTMNPILTLFSTGLGYLGGEIERFGRKGCSVIMATPCPDEWNLKHHAAYPLAWELLKKEHDPYILREQEEAALASNEEYVQKYRFQHSFHPVHGLWAAHPVRRLKHCGQLFVAGAKDPALVRSVGFMPTATIAEALAKARELHDAKPRIAVVFHTPG